MATRKRELQADNQGRYRPRIGWLWDEGEGSKQPRFNLGTDRKEAERQYSNIQELYDDYCKVNGEDCWSHIASSIWLPRVRCCLKTM